MCKKDTVEVEKKILEFYRRIVFGRNYIKDDRYKYMNNIEKWCFDGAWKDMSQHVLKWNSKNLTTLEKQQERDEVFQQWSQDKWLICSKNDKIRSLITNLHVIVSNRINTQKTEIAEFTYGQAQKVVNMFFKYLYTFKDCNTQIANFDFSICDCPVDNITLKRIKNDFNCNDISENKSGERYVYKYKKTVWSKLNKEQYEEIQKIISDNVSNRFEYEYDWE